MGRESTREQLVNTLRRHVRDQRVLDAIAAVPRERFVTPERLGQAWDNEALPIGGGQTISQPLVVAHMCELLAVRPGDKVLDVGTGSGYHAAVLAALGARVWSIERDGDLTEQARLNLTRAEINGVTLVVGDGSRGLPDQAPFDAINVAASSRHGVPAALTEQLASGGRLVLPVGDELVLVRRGSGGQLERIGAGAVRFVPLIEGE
jgi:protein-L-isoaspartate(D-aspartate) O-methyltransferase